MTSVLTIDGKEYVPATVAGKHFGYTKDYLLMLIKQGHIEGQKIWNKWYVNIPSAEKHFRVAREKREVRRKEISLERKAELRVHARLHTSQKKSSKKSSYTNAPLKILAVLVVTLFLSASATSVVGIHAQQASLRESTYGFFEGIARSLFSFFSPEPTVHVIERTELPSISSTTIEEESLSASVVGTTTHTSIIVAPDEVFTATTVEAIQDSFSDPVKVSVDSENPNTGIITPVFKDGKHGEDYRFLMVPVTKPATTT